MDKPVDVVVLAADEGTRMRSRIPKVLHPVAGLPLLHYVLDSAASCSPSRIVVVTGHRGELVEEYLAGRDVQLARQGELSGSIGAIIAARPFLNSPTILVLPGDMPLVPEEALRALVEHHRAGGFWATVLTYRPSGASNSATLLRPGGQVANLGKGEASAKESAAVSSGIWCLENRPELWEALSRISASRGGECNLEELASELAPRGLLGSLAWGEEEDLLGVDSRLDLARLETIIRARVTEELLEAGVSLPDPGAVTISPGVVVGQDTIIYPGSYLLGATQVGEACRIGPNAYLADSQLDDEVLVWFSVLEGAQVDREATVGPFAHLRPGSRVGARARVGNFVELKNASLGEEAKAAHLSYIGDARVGDRANIGAGTITCNYDGVKKHSTEIGPGAFIGSNSALVAPVKIGEGAYVGAGSVITEDVPPYALALGRARQVIKPDWAKNRREARK